MIATYEVESNGKLKTKIGFVPAKQFPLYQHELVDALNKEHYTLANERTVGAAWLAFPCFDRVENDDNEIDSFIDKYAYLLDNEGVWNGITMA